MRRINYCVIALDVIPHSRCPSLAGGASVAYVFVYLLPELNRGQRTLEEAGAARAVAFVPVHAYAVAWLLAGAMLAGWGVGLSFAISKAAVAVLFAFLSGGVILNVLKEEWPQERQSRFCAFGVGALG